MDTASEEIHFQKIQELVKDDDKIVTVSSLASDLNISLQNSRNLISKYVEDQKQLKLDGLAVTYVISGILKENGKKGIFMMKEADLEPKRNIFEPNPYEVIYSIQKNKNVDFNIIALVDMFDSTKIRDTALNGSIVSKNCIKRTLKFKKLPSPPRPTLKGKSSFFVPKTEGSTSSKKLNVSPKTEQKDKASGGIADLFKTAAAKPKNGNNSTPVKTSKPAPKLGGLAGFFTNGTVKSSKNTTKNKAEMESIHSKTQNNSSKSENRIIVEDDEISDIMDTDFGEKPPDLPSENKAIKIEIAPKKKEKEVKKISKQERQKPHKRQRDKSKELPSKRRKRIIERNDSDSDDIFEKEDDNDDIIEKSDEEPERVPSPVVQKPVVPKNKRRKAVTKNYEDEEGFIVTKTEYVYETASEDENVEPDPPKQEKKEEKATVKSKVPEKKKPAKNQSTLMNFFTKK